VARVTVRVLGLVLVETGPLSSTIFVLGRLLSSGDRPRREEGSQVLARPRCRISQSETCFCHLKPPDLDRLVPSFISFRFL